MRDKQTFGLRRKPQTVSAECARAHTYSQQRFRPLIRARAFSCPRRPNSISANYFCIRPKAIDNERLFE